MPAPSEVWIASSREELLAGAERREVVTRDDGKSGSVFELVTIDGQRYFAKTLGYRTDWIMRVTGDRDLRPLKIWRAGIMSGAPAEVDHAIVGMAADGENEDALLTVLMRDIGEHLIPEGDTVIPLPTHERLIDGLAALSARYWGWQDDISLTTIEERLRFFAPDNIAAEAAVDDPPAPIAVAMQGWPRVAELDPALAELLAAIHATPTPLADAMRVDARNLPARRLEDGQPRYASRRAHDPHRLGVPGLGPGVLGPGVVPRAELPEVADHEGGDHRDAPRRARTPRRGDRRMVRPPARSLPAWHDRVLRLGESSERPGRVRVVGAPRDRRRASRRRPLSGAVGLMVGRASTEPGDVDDGPDEPGCVVADERRGSRHDRRARRREKAAR